MNDGEGEECVKFLTEKENQTSKRKTRSGIDEFAQAIARISVAQVCESLGFQSFQHSALDNLADVAVRYIREIGKTASLFANLSNRIQCNIFDVIQSLEDLGSVQGFSGASDVSHSLSRSGVVRDIIRYVDKAEEVPFAYLIPGFPVIKERRLKPSFAQADENSPGEHIPGWLPKFPDPKGYVDLDSRNLKASQTVVDEKLQQAEGQHKKVEKPLLNLQPNLICNGSEAGVVVEQEYAAKVQHVPESNPFLAPPLQFGQKQVSLPFLPAKLLEETSGNDRIREVEENHNSSLEPILSVNQPVEGSLPEDRRNILLGGRPNVQFKFGNGEKSLARGMSHHNGIGKVSLWFGDDSDVKDDKKWGSQNLLENE